mmetsp:Transcript_2149/g.3894  ORF Transcript_2149/g.3894 Transcript_2149/m.3894 type:complete len:93 (+) Transcript_2149:581-859(+)
MERVIFCLDSKRTFDLVDIQASKALFSLGPNKLMRLEYVGKQITRNDQRDDQGLGTENNSSSALFLTIILVYRTVALRFWSCILLSSLTIIL